MTDPNSTDTESLLKKLLGTVLSHQKEVSELKEENRIATTNHSSHRTNPKKRPRDGNASAEVDTESSRNGEENDPSDHKGDRDSKTEAIEITRKITTPLPTNFRKQARLSWKMPSLLD